MAVATTGVVLGVASVSAAALLLYGGQGVVRSAGLLIAAVLLATGAGVWVGGARSPLSGPHPLLGRWTFAVIALLVASFIAGVWFRSPSIQSLTWAGPVALVLLLAEPAYALGALLAGLAGRGRDGVAVPALVGTAVGVVLATSWLIHAFPPGLVFLGLALVLTGAGSLEMKVPGGVKEAGMADRVVIVTGVGDPGQVGYAVAEAFVRQGARVVVSSRGETIVERARSLGGDVVGVAADLADPEGAAAVVEVARERWGRLDALVNVAGGLHVMKSVEETTPEEWQREVDSNARTAFLMSRAALPLLRESGGAIVNFASPAGLRAVKGMAAYSAGKAAVVSLTQALAREEEASEVRVNAIAPGMVDTAQNRASMSDAEAFVSREAIVEAVLFLAEARGVSGEVLGVRFADMSRDTDSPGGRGHG